MKKIKNKKRTKFIIFGSVVMVIIIALLFLINKGEDKQDIYVVTKKDVSNEFTFAGIVEAEKRVDLGFAISGRVSKNHFKEGDFVKKGNVIAEIDQNTLRANLIQANANYILTRVDTSSSKNEVENKYKKTYNEQNTIVDGLRQQYISGDLKAYLIDADIVRNITPPTITGSYLGEKEGTYTIDVYKSSSNSGFSYNLSGLERGTSAATVNQPSTLGKLGLYIQFKDNINYKDTRWEVQIPNTRSSTYFLRKSKYDDAIAGRDKNISLAEDAKNSILVVDKVTDISRSDAQIENARAQVSSIYSKLADGKIRAPFDGYIAKDDLNIGEMVTAFETPIVFLKNNNKKLVLNTPEIYINSINVGDSVSIEFDAYPGEFFDGVISSIDSINSLIDGVPVYQTDVRIIDNDNKIRIGMNAHALIIKSNRKDIIAIPKHFINKKDGKNIVFVVSNSGITEKVVNLGLEGNNGLVEIISGLLEGQSIIKKK